MRLSPKAHRFVKEAAGELGGREGRERLLEWLGRPEATDVPYDIAILASDALHRLEHRMRQRLDSGTLDEDQYADVTNDVALIHAIDSDLQKQISERRGTYIVLAVDNDPGLLDLVSIVLEESGYTVLTAKNGYEALRILAERHVDLMITDIRMPGLTGLELAARAKLARPGLHVLYLTGYQSSAAEQDSLPADGTLLRKPVKADVLIAAIGKEMAAS